MNLHEDSSKGLRAEQLLNSDIYKECIGKVRQGIFDAWATCPVRDTEGQHELRLMLKVVDDLESNIKSMVNTGKLAAKQLEQERSIKEQAKDAIKGVFSMIRR